MRPYICLISLLTAAPVVQPASADGATAPAQATECQSCTSRHKALQKLQDHRANKAAQAIAPTVETGTTDTAFEQGSLVPPASSEAGE